MKCGRSEKLITGTGFSFISHSRETREKPVLSLRKLDDGPAEPWLPHLSGVQPLVFDIHNRFNLHPRLAPPSRP